MGTKHSTWTTRTKNGLVTMIISHRILVNAGHTYGQGKNHVRGRERGGSIPLWSAGCRSCGGNDSPSPTLHSSFEATVDGT